MKKTVPAAIILCFALMLTSCAANDTAPELVSGGQTKVAAGKNASGGGQNNASDEYGITFNGVKLTLDAEVNPLVKALGKEYVYTKNFSCAYIGADTTYDYKSLIIYAQQNDGKEVVNTIEVRDDKADCFGIKIGQTFDDVKKSLGEPVATEGYGIIYRKDGQELQFISDGSGKIIFILYTHDTSEAN